MKEAVKKTSIGGQALIEGILMRGPDKMAIVCRTKDGIDIEEKKLAKKEKSWTDMPFVRGPALLISSMKIGIDALMHSADLAYWEEEEEESIIEKYAPEKISNFYAKHQENIDKWGSIFISLVLALVLFFFIPTLLVQWFGKRVSNSIVLNLIEGIIRLTIFLIYVLTISKMKEIHRVFGYHGAEHKSIHCYEHGEDLTVENVKKYPIEHPRCGTSFLLNLMLISIIVLSFFGWPNPLVRLVVRLITLPIIAGITYEINRLMGRSDGMISRIFSKPGLWLQKIATVREPDEEQIEVAIIALEAVIPCEGVADEW